MGVESFTSFELFQGGFGLAMLTVNFLLGIRIVSKYRTIKRKELITVGLMLIFLYSAWWGSAISFITILVFNVDVSDTFYIIISYGLIPIASLLWMYSFALLVYPHSKWKLFLIYLVFNFAYVIIFFYYLITNPSLLVIRVSKIDSETELVVTSYVMITLAISLITTFIFMRKSMLSPDKTIQWKGKLIFLALVIFVIGAVLDSVVSLTPPTLFFTRLILMISSVISYIGWIMPPRVAKLLSKEEA
ncbi:MAG: hypothetical protein ACTSU4_03700 [Promethearchaeota archaeon]